MNNLAKMFVAYRQKHDISQTEIAKQIGVSKSTMCRIEDGYDFDLDTLGKIAAWMRRSK